MAGAAAGDDVMSGASWGCRIGAMFILLVVGLIGAWVPLALKQCNLGAVIAVLNTFAGGAFLGLSVFHIMPEAAQHIEAANLFLEVGDGKFNLAYLFLFFGYVAILICEQILTVDNPGGHSHGQRAPHCHPGHQGECESGAAACPCSCGRRGSMHRSLSMVPNGAERESRWCEDKQYVRPCDCETKETAEGATEFSSTVVTVCPFVTEGEEKSHNSLKVVQHVEPKNFKYGKTQEDIVDGFRAQEDQKGAFNGRSTPERIVSDQKMSAIVPQIQEEGSVAELDGISRGDEREMTHWFDTCRRRFNFDGTSFFLMVALAIHGLFEGMIVGAEANLIAVWVVTCVISGHKWAESLMLMSQFIARGISPRWCWILMAVFIASSPVGVLIGVGLRSEGEVASGVANALGAGTLLYVAAETSTSVFVGSRGERVVQLIVYCLGASMVLGLTLLDLALDA